MPATDNIVIIAVLLLRFLAPLLIPRFPLPGILACLLIDGIDQTIFQAFTSLQLDWYQNYDKALDIYYLVIAYLSTLRNWRNRTAFQISRFLIYYRLIGVTLFELIEWRPLLLIFPNTFEYFFIAYEVVRSRWNPMRVSKERWLATAAGIWVFIKLPQEWWIHIAQLDTTELIQEKLFGVSPDAGLLAGIANRPWVAAIAIALLVVILLAASRLLVPRLPSPEHGWELAAERLPRRADTPEEKREVFLRTRQPIDRAVLEKIILVTLVTLIFGQILPNYRGTTLQLAVAVGAIITVNSVISYWFARRGVGWRSALAQFSVLLIVNEGIVVAGQMLLGEEPLGTAGPGWFLLALLTLLITLYDYFRPVYSARFETRGRGGGKVATT